MKIEKLPSLEYINQALDYCPDSGLFTWKERPRDHFNSDRGWRVFNSNYANKGAGTISEHGYLRIRLGERSVMAHRIAMMLIAGFDPHPMRIDHIDGNRLNNRSSNLRLANGRQNSWNTPCRSNSRTGLKGVYKHSQYGKYVAFLKKEYLGVFDTADEAYAARLKREVEIYGEYAYIDPRFSHLLQSREANGLQ